MKHFFVTLLFIISCTFLFSESSQIVWNINNLTKIGGYSIDVKGSPSIIKTSDGDSAVEFNALTDTSTERIKIQVNPLVNDTDFTVEVIFSPYNNYYAFKKSHQPYIFDICNPDSVISPKHQLNCGFYYENAGYGWNTLSDVIGDTYFVLAESNHTFTTNSWYHMAVTYSKSTSKLNYYVNGNLIYSHTGSHIGLFNSLQQVSIGSLMYPGNYFKGAIKKIIFTHKAITESDFTYDIASYTTDIKFSKTINDYALNQNYPNPVSKQTTITYTVPRSEYVRLDLYNLMGERVKTMVDGTVDAGTHEVYFEKDNLPVGVYFYTMSTSSGYKQTKKMQIIY